ncbi:MAG TPA: hypothetical protein DEQ74_02195 [Wolbachia sp.]|jgi:hypothetical protein|uniref:hypothetical protein n=1 Tax=Wolbachia endosymbiont of Pentalonia nigronervosa TaxID=1301914 RepID=UPI000ED3F70F|nr:hypothetical protein [Wolbachia endosymbiont of Pentalonia nigronervosa]MBD0391207.1 hypothetical protein [Wolbachia endosymbiont of Pentalonia nigronervosa]HCE59620.1 hypothetical protein [Wolbachia sp.]
MKKSQQIEWQQSEKTVRQPTDLSFQMYKKEGGPGGVRAPDKGIRRQYFGEPNSKVSGPSSSQPGSSKDQKK